MIDEVLEPLKACSHLVELCLQCDENEIEMNRVLSCCMSLETLMVNATTIGRGKTNAMEIKHKLKTLTMIGEDIEDAMAIRAEALKGSKKRK
ncbi:hypothetical protein DFQ28_000367 [Apophysomyces sp. BC1034]|nr:hypothetical protein DFQ28_000367 [Apophysomyces sp. BC1034]